MCVCVCVCVLSNFIYRQLLLKKNKKLVKLFSIY